MYKPDYIAIKCVVGLDRDGVINKDIGDYVYKVEDWEFEDGSLEAPDTQIRAQNCYY